MMLKMIVGGLHISLANIMKNDLQNSIYFSEKAWW